MAEIDKRARIAGATYVGLSIPAFFAMMYVPGQVVVSGDILATVDKVLAHESLFRWGAAAELLDYGLWVLVALALYRLFAEVDRGLAWLMVILGVLTVPIVMVGDAAELAALSILHDAKLAAALSPAQLKALAGFGLKLHSGCYTAGEVFWGLWLLPMAALTWRSGFLPKWLGAVLAISGFAWTLDALMKVATPSTAAAWEPPLRLATSGELPFMLWLLFIGARSRLGPPVAAAPFAVDG